jgi:hypothetical protein
MASRSKPESARECPESRFVVVYPSTVETEIKRRPLWTRGRFSFRESIFGRRRVKSKKNAGSVQNGGGVSLPPSGLAGNPRKIRRAGAAGRRAENRASNSASDANREAFPAEPSPAGEIPGGLVRSGAVWNSLSLDGQGRATGPSLVEAGLGDVSLSLCFELCLERPRLDLIRRDTLVEPRRFQCPVKAIGTANLVRRTESVASS